MSFLPGPVFVSRRSKASGRGRGLPLAIIFSSDTLRQLSERYEKYEKIQKNTTATLQCEWTYRGSQKLTKNSLMY